MNEIEPTLVVRNAAQKILWETELTGQISDGQWENSRPNNHYLAWCNAECEVGENVGRNFGVRRVGYNFTELCQYDWFIKRNIAAVREGTGDETYDEKRLRKDLNDLKRIMRIETATYPEGVDYWKAERYVCRKTREWRERGAREREAKAAAAAAGAAGVTA